MSCDMMIAEQQKKACLYPTAWRNIFQHQCQLYTGANNV